MNGAFTHEKEFKNWIFNRFSRTFDSLTEFEAWYLARTEMAEVIRDRIAAAESTGDCGTVF